MASSRSMGSSRARDGMLASLESVESIEVLWVQVTPTRTRTRTTSPICERLSMGEYSATDDLRKLSGGRSLPEWPSSRDVWFGRCHVDYKSNGRDQGQHTRSCMRTYLNYGVATLWITLPKGCHQNV